MFERDSVLGRVVRLAPNLLLACSVGAVSAAQIFSRNLREVSYGQFLSMLTFAVVVSLAIFAAAYLLIRNKHKATAVTVLATMMFFNYESIYNWYISHTAGVVAQHGVLMLLLAMLVFAFYLMIAKVSTHRIVEAEWVAAAVAAIYFMLCLPAMGGAFISNWGFKLQVRNADIKSVASSAKPPQAPDIYYIMPDDYAGNIALKKTYHYDNSAFTDSLKSLGFYVPSKSYSNYPTTTTSLASSFGGGMLSMSGNTKATASRQSAYPLIKGPEVAKFLQEKGYKFTQLGSWWGPTQKSSVADENKQYAWDVTFLNHTLYLQEFMGFFVGRTPIRPLLEKNVKIGSFTASAWGGFHGYNSLFMDQVQGLKDVMARQAGPPKLVFAHLLVPHGPNVFDADGGPADASLSDDDAYIAQLKFTNSKLLELIKTLQSTKRGRAAVVVLASDEGQFPADRSASASVDDIRQKVNILSAIYFPDKDYKTLYPTITPVNHFRVVLNKYLGTRLKLQPDTIYTYSKDEAHLFNLTDVTSKIR